MILAVGGFYGVLSKTNVYRNTLEKIAKSLKGKSQETEAKKRTLISYDELFMWPLAAACIFLTLGIAINLARPKPAP